MVCNDALKYDVLEELSIFEPHVYESMFIKLHTGSKKDVIIGNVYRPNTAPKANLEQALEHHKYILNKINSDKDLKNCDVTILGDLNIDLLQFSNHNLTNQYLESLLSLGFLPVVTKPTRIHKQSATLIDHIFTNKKANVYETGIIESPLSDHYPVFYIEQTKVQRSVPEIIKTRKINNETTKSFCDLLESAPWNNVINEKKNIHCI